MEIIIPISLRWSDLDPNAHVRHSVYYDWGAMARIEFFQRCNVDSKLMAENHVGPILFREEAIFRREVRYGNKYTIDLVATSMRKDFSRFSFRHAIVREDGTHCATINIDGAWIDTQKRKLCIPPPGIAALAEAAPKSEDFSWI